MRVTVSAGGSQEWTGSVQIKKQQVVQVDIKRTRRLFVIKTDDDSLRTIVADGEGIKTLALFELFEVHVADVLPFKYADYDLRIPCM